MQPRLVHFAAPCPPISLITIVTPCSDPVLRPCSQPPLSRALRTICCASLLHGGLPKAMLQWAHRSVAHAYGYKVEDGPPHTQSCQRVVLTHHPPLLHANDCSTQTLIPLARLAQLGMLHRSGDTVPQSEFADPPSSAALPRAQHLAPAMKPPDTHTFSWARLNRDLRLVQRHVSSSDLIEPRYKRWTRVACCCSSVRFLTLARAPAPCTATWIVSSPTPPTHQLVAG